MKKENAQRIKTRMEAHLLDLVDSTLPLLPPHLRDNEKRREWLHKHLLSLQTEAHPELKIHICALEEALPNLLDSPPACLGIGGNGRIFCSESMKEIEKLLRENSPPFLRDLHAPLTFNYV